jgi:hypothetical protein
MPRESAFQSVMISIIRDRFPGCIVLKNDPNYLQGFPDILILYKNKWAALETKISSSAHKQPNQEYYVDLLDTMSYASFVHPENKDRVLNELQQAFSYSRSSRFPERE